MANTYETGAEADADYAQQERMLTALDAAPRALRRDECGRRSRSWAANQLKREPISS